MAKEQTYNPYKHALTLLQEQLDLSKIPMVTAQKQPGLINLPDIGFDVDSLKKWLTNFQRNGFKPKRTIKQFNGYEIFQCMRQSYYMRMGAPYDMSKIAQYPFSTIKATMGTIIEQLLLSMHNQAEGTKFRNGIHLHWKTNEEFGTLFPIAMVVDGISYDETVMLDVKFTDQYDDMHLKQVKLYILAWKHVYKKLVKFAEVVYVNGAMNAITKRRFEINDEVQNIEFPATIERIKTYDKCLRNMTLPTAEPHNCNFCAYEKACQENLNKFDSDDPMGSKNEPVKIISDKKDSSQIKIENHPVPDANIKILI